MASKGLGKLDSSWLSAFQSNDDGAAEDLASFVERACSRFRSELGDDWRDLVQESLVECIKVFREPSAERIENLGGIVWRICSRNAIDRRRSRGRWSWVNPDMLQYLSGQDEIAQVEGEDARRKKEAVILRDSSDRCRRVWRAILQGRDQAEIAESLGISPAALRVQLFRCRQHAKRSLQEWKESYRARDRRSGDGSA
jgi:RNA polymerase sigma factor (sigma-70 family)